MNHYHSELTNLLTHRILILDGAMGTMIQKHRLSQADYHGERFANWPKDLKGNNDLLVLTQPQIINDIHTAYLEAGADIIETNTFNANRISLADYGMEELAYELNVTATRLAKTAAAKFSTSDKPRFVLCGHMHYRHEYSIAWQNGTKTLFIALSHIRTGTHSIAIFNGTASENIYELKV